MTLKIALLLCVISPGSWAAPIDLTAIGAGLDLRSAANHFNLPSLKSVREAYVAEVPQRLAQISTEDQYVLRATIAAWAELGQAAGLGGPVLYYPFGGMDGVAGFILNSGVTDVVVQSSHPFFSIKEMRHFLTAADPYYRFPHYLPNFESGRDFREIQISVGTESLGGLSLARMVTFLNVEPVGLFALTVNDNGQSVNIAAPDSDPSALVKQGVIVFSRADGTRIRLWYFLHHTSYGETPVSKFLQKIKIDSLLIKAAPNPWLPHDDSSEEMAREARRFALTAAFTHNARVLTDEALRDSFASRTKVRMPQQIWATTPKLTATKAAFGYSDTGDYVFFGDGKDLDLKTGGVGADRSLWTRCMDWLTNRAVD